MRAIQIIDLKTSKSLYLREYFLDGRVLVCEHEETMLRLMRRIPSETLSGLSVKLTVARYTGDLRRYKPKKLTAATADAAFDTQLNYLA